MNAQPPCPNRPTSLPTLLTGLERVWDSSSESTPTQAQLAQRLIAQGQAQGLPITAREAHLAAQLLLVPIVSTASSSSSAPTVYLSDAQVATFLRLPPLAPTVSEKALQRASRLSPRRWGKALGQAVVGALVCVATLKGVIWFAAWNAGGQHLSLLGDVVQCCLSLLWFVATTAGVFGGALTALICLLDALTGFDTSVYDARQQATYRAQLEALPTPQLRQVYAAMRESCAARYSDLSWESEVVMAAHAVLAERDQHGFHADPQKSDNLV